MHSRTTVVDAESNVFKISIYKKPQQFLDNLIVIALLLKRFFHIPSLSSELCCDFSALFLFLKFQFLQIYSVVSPVILLCSVTF